MLSVEHHTAESKAWLHDRFEELTDSITILQPSEWAEEKRYLPPQVTSMPGFYSFDPAPYLREILDNLSPHSYIREVDVMKGVQIGFTVGVLENAIGYDIDHIKNAPIMLLTADQELAQLRMESYITPMINHSGLSHLIKSSDTKNTRKTGKTDKKVEWEGGGFLIPFGAKSLAKLISISIQKLYEDEVDVYPDTVGKGGCPSKLAEERTAAYEASRKILRGSCPLIAQTSKILREYKKGDQRKYMVPCRHCGKKQELKFKGVNKETGAEYGIVFKLDDGGVLIEESVKYLCEYCQGEHTNDDKVWWYREGGKHCEWVPTARPQSHDRRSYHLPALYSPVGMQTWATQVKKWLDAWDVEADRVKDLDALQHFYNNVLGLPYEMRGEALKLERVVMHRRAIYYSGQVPNKAAEKEAGGKIQLLTASVDVHKEHLDIQVIGWCRGGRFYSIEWEKLEGDCENIEKGPWQQLREIIEGRVYKADDGRLYRIQITLIDSQYNTDLVNSFCAEYSSGVFAIRGNRDPIKSAAVKEFSEFETKLGTRAYNVTVNIYKDRLAVALKREWDGVSIQPNGHPNFPQDYPESFFKELTVETKREVVNSITGQRTGFVWHRPSGAANHAWDLTVYCSAGLDMTALETCQLELGLEFVDWAEFWNLCEERGLFWEAGVK